MKAVLICYTLTKTTPTKRTALKRQLTGYKDYSNKGEYTYQRKGLLTNIPHIKPTRSALIIKKEDEHKIKKILQKCNAHIRTYNIQINKTEFKTSNQ